jgi:hypothetical protein
VVPLRNSEEVEIEECYPLSVDVPVHADLLQRLRSLVRGGSEVNFPWTDGQPLGFGECPETEIAQGGVQRRRQGGGARLPPCAGAQPLQIAGSALQDHLETRGALFRGFHSQGLRPRGAERDSRALAVVGRRLEPKMEPNRVLDETNP